MHMVLSILDARAAPAVTQPFPGFGLNDHWETIQECKVCDVH